MNIQTKAGRALTNPPPAGNHNERKQSLVIRLDGVTAGDYLTWVHDPDPPALGRELRSIAVEADPLGHRIEVDLVWDRPPPDPCRAAVAAGFVLSSEVATVLIRHLDCRATNRRGDRRSR